MKAITYETTGADLPPDSLALCHIWTDDIQAEDGRIYAWIAPEKVRVVALLQDHPLKDKWRAWSDPDPLALAILKTAIDLPHTCDCQLSCGGVLVKWALVRRFKRSRRLIIVRAFGRGHNTGEPPAELSA